MSDPKTTGAYMTVKMLETRRGSEDGFTLRVYHKDETYRMGRTLACRFLVNGWAVDMDTSTFEERLQAFMEELRTQREKLNAA